MTVRALETRPDDALLSRQDPPRLWWTYAFAVAVTVATVALRLALEGPLGGEPTLMIFTLPIMVSAYAGGLGPGLLATALSCFLASYYLLPPVYSIEVASAVDRWQQGFVALAGVVISVLNEALHRARRRADAAGRERQRVEDDRQRFFALSSDVLCILGFDGFFKDLNPAWETTLGYEKAELLDTPFIEFVHPDDRGVTLSEAAKVSSGNALIAFENRYRCRDGTYRWLQWSVTPVVADQVMYGVARDITEHKRRDQALHQSEEYFRFLNDLVEATRTLADPEAIMATMARMLGMHLRASRCAYADVERDGEHFTILHDYTDGCATTVGRYRLSRFGARAVATLHHGQTLVIRSVEAELLPADGADMFTEIGIKAIVTCPLVKDGSLRALMAVHQTVPRDWTASEVTIIQDVVERCWATIERRAAEENVAREQARVRRLMDSNAQGVAFWKTKGEILKANDAFLRLVGYTREDLEAGRIDWAKMTPPEYAHRDQQSLEELAASGSCTPFEKEYFRKDGSRVSVMVGAAIFEDTADEGVCFVVDVTARNQAEAARRIIEGKYRSLFECAPDGIVVANPASYYLDANDAICRMLGYERGELIGMHASTIVVEAEIPNIGMGLSALEPGAVYEREWQLRRKSGSVFDAEVFATRMPDGNLLGIIRDITERKTAARLAADALRELNYVKGALDEHDIVAVTDRKGTITYVNDKFCAISQYSRDELIGQDHRIVNSGFHSKEFIASIWQTIALGRVWKGEIKNRAKDGTFYWVDTTIVPYLGEDGLPSQYIAIRADITERKRFELELQRKNLELEDASRMKSEFLANMSHELRTPLNAIIGFSELLKDGLTGELSDQQHKFIGDIFESGTHLLSLINDILDLSKVEAGKMGLDLESVPLASLFANSVSIIREKAAARHISVDVELAEELGSIQADARKVKQIVYNLLSNAVKFTSDGGHVRLRAAIVGRDDVGRPSSSWAGVGGSLSDSAFTTFLQIRVVDNGMGISPADLAHLFQPFTQIDSGLSRQFEGTGLGLAMVKLLAELHGGVVGVESAVGEGSSFTVWLPVRALAVQGIVTPDLTMALSRVATGDGARTALVVEDDVKAADLIRLYLEAEGFAVLHAASAEAALVLAAQQPLSLITLDVLLPDMDGWEFLGRLKQTPDMGRVPVVIISIMADANRGFALGAAAVMQKPISRQELYTSFMDLGLLPVPRGHTLKVLVVDDDPVAVELVAVRVLEFAGTVLRAYGGRQAIEIARRELPDLIVLDLMMPGVNGFDVVAALNERPGTARLPILVVTAKQITAEDRAKLSGYMTTIMEKAEFDGRFAAEVRRAISVRRLLTT